MQKIIRTFILVSLACIPYTYALAQEIVGFVSAPIWFSGTPTQGIPVDVHTVVYNGRDGVLSATVQFLDGKSVLGEKVVSVPAKTALHTKITWLPTPGAHAVSAQIVKATINQNNVVSTVVPDNSTSEPVSVTIVPKETPTTTIQTKTDETAITAKDTQSDRLEGTLAEPLTDSFSEIISKTINSFVSTLGALFEKKSEAVSTEKQTTDNKTIKSTDTNISNKTQDSTSSVEDKSISDTETQASTSISTQLFATIDGFRDSLATGVKEASLKAEESVALNNTKMQAQKDARVEKKLNIDAQDQAVPTVQESADSLGSGTGSQFALYFYKTLSFVLETPFVFYALVGIMTLFLFSALFNRFREDN